MTKRAETPREKLQVELRQLQCAERHEHTVCNNCGCSLSGTPGPYRGSGRRVFCSACFVDPYRELIEDD